MNKKPNSAKGVNSYDSTTTGTLIPFFNRNVSEYPTEAGGIKFDLVPVTKQKDLMINHARMYAQQEYDRIMQLVEVLEKQATISCYEANWITVFTLYYKCIICPLCLPIKLIGAN